MCSRSELDNLTLSIAIKNKKELNEIDDVIEQAKSILPKIRKDVNKLQSDVVKNRNTSLRALDLADEAKVLSLKTKSDLKIIQDGITSVDEYLDKLKKDIDNINTINNDFGKTLSNTLFNVSVLNAINGKSFINFESGLYFSDYRATFSRQNSDDTYKNNTSEDVVYTRFVILNNTTMQNTILCTYDNGNSITTTVNVVNGLLIYKISMQNGTYVQWDEKDFRHYVLLQMSFYSGNELVKVRTLLIKFDELDQTEIDLNDSLKSLVLNNISIIFDDTSITEMVINNECEYMTFFSRRMFIYDDYSQDELYYSFQQSLNMYEMYINTKNDLNIEKAYDTIGIHDSNANGIERLTAIITSLSKSVTNLNMNTPKRVMKKLNYTNKISLNIKPKLNISVWGQKSVTLSRDDFLAFGRVTQVSSMLTNDCNIPSMTPTKDTPISISGDSAVLNLQLKDTSEYAGDGISYNLATNYNVNFNNSVGEIVVMTETGIYTLWEFFQIGFSGASFSSSAGASGRSKTSIAHFIKVRDTIVHNFKLRQPGKSIMNAYFLIKYDQKDGEVEANMEVFPPLALPLTSKTDNSGTYKILDNQEVEIKESASTWNSLVYTSNNITRLKMTESIKCIPQTEPVYVCVGSTPFDINKLMLQVNDEGSRDPEVWPKIDTEFKLNPLTRGSYLGFYFSRYNGYSKTPRNDIRTINLSSKLKIKFDVDYNTVRQPTSGSEIHKISMMPILKYEIILNGQSLSSVNECIMSTDVRPSDPMYILFTNGLYRYFNASTSALNISADTVKVSVSWIGDPLKIGYVQVENADFNALLSNVINQGSQLALLGFDLKDTKDRLSYIEKFMAQNNGSQFGNILGSIGALTSVIMPLVGVSITVLGTLITFAEMYASGNDSATNILINITSLAQAALSLIAYKRSKAPTGVQPPGYSQIFPRGLDLPIIEAKNQAVIIKNKIKQLEFKGFGKPFSTQKDNNHSNIQYTKLIDLDTPYVTSSKIKYEILYAPLNGLSKVGKYYGKLIQKQASGMINPYESVMLHSLEKMNIVPMHQYMKLTEMNTSKGVTTLKHTYIGVAEGNAVSSNGTMIGTNNFGSIPKADTSTPGYIDFIYKNSVQKPNTYVLDDWRNSGMDRLRIIEFATGGEIKRPYSDKDVQNMYAALAKDFSFQRYVRKEGTVPAVAGHLDLMKNMIIDSRQNYNYRFIGNNCQTFVSDMMKMFKDPSYKPAWISNADHNKYQDKLYQLFINETSV